MIPQGIIVLDGADSSGKTTLARYFVEHYGARYLHVGPSDRVWLYHLAAFRRAERLAAAGELVVMDRHWMSECVYGSVYRGGSAYPVTARCFDRLWIRSAAVNVLCAPRDSERQLAEHDRMRGIRSEYAADIRDVVAYYRDLREGNVARSGSSYLAQYARHDDYTVRRDVYIYDRFEDGAYLEKVARSILARLSVLRAGQHPLMFDPTTPKVAGHPDRARVVIICDDVVCPSIPYPAMTGVAAFEVNGRLHRSEITEPSLLWVTIGADYVPVESVVLLTEQRIIDLPWFATSERAVAAVGKLGFRVEKLTVKRLLEVQR